MLYSAASLDNGCGSSDKKSPVQYCQYASIVSSNLLCAPAGLMTWDSRSSLKARGGTDFDI